MNKSVLHATLFALTFSGYAQEVTQKLDAYMQALTQLNRFSGTVVVAHGDTLLLNKGYGYANHDFEVPNAQHTKFRICSITKMITATAIMQLQEKGLLKTTDYINTYLPDYPRGNEITIHQLLNHTAGLSSFTNHVNGFTLEMVVFPPPLEQIVSFIKDKPLESQPGSKYEYSNAGYYLLSYIIEKVTGKKYETYITENILNPLGMKNCCFGDHENKIIKNCASGYCFNTENQFVNGHYTHTSGGSGCGGLYCTAYDLYTFARALHNKTLLTQQSLEAMFTAYSNQENYGYGCSIQTILSHKIIEHGGMLSSGFKSNLSLFINDELYIVLLSNLFSAWTYEARDALAAIVFEKPYEIPTIKPITIDQAIYDDYVGQYDHPESLLKICKKENKLLLNQDIQLIPYAKDKFFAGNRNSPNLVYIFMRDEKNSIIQLRIKGGFPYFEIRCEKKEK